MTRQQGTTTVGDTITVVHRIAVPAGAVVEARMPTDSSIATMVGAPLVTREADSVQIAYTMAIWAPGQNVLVLPGAVVINERGVVDTLPDAHVPLDVASLLPAGKAATAIAPRAAMPWLPNLDRSVLPFITLVPVALVLVGGLYWWRRRRGPVLVPRPTRSVAATLTDDRVATWIEAGEARLVLEHIEAQVRDRSDFVDWRQRADLQRFAPGQDAAVEALAREGWSRLHQSPSA